MTSAKMIWSILLLGVALADKLDRAYLPPPGFKLSGGSPGAVKVPLEHPRLEYTSSNNEYPANPDIAVGINRVAPNRPTDKISPIDNLLIQSKNSFPSPTTLNPYQQNNNVNTINEYSTSQPIDYTSKYNGDLKNPGSTEYYSREQIRGQHPFSPVTSQFQTTEDSPQLIQNVPISGINNDNNAKSYFNQSKPDGELDSIINTISEYTSIPKLGADSKISQFGSSKHSSVPIAQAYSDVISSTFAPSTENYNFGTAVGPNQFYSSTAKPPQVTTTNSINYKYAPVPNYTIVKMRPERIQAQADREASILNYESSITPEGYSYTYDTSNGIHADETGVTVDGTKAKGSYSYIGDDGKLYNIVYTADEYGFQPRGDHLPTSPPIPEAILRVIEQVTKEKEAGITDDGSYDENKYGYRKYHNGFYTPKSDFPNQQSGIGNKQNKYVKNFITNGGATGNETPIKTERVLTPYKNIINSDVTTSRPISNNYYSDINKYMKYIDSPNVQQPYVFHNESDVKNFGPYIGDDQTSIGDAKNIFPEQQNVYKQVNNRPILENERNFLVDTQKPTDKALVDFKSSVEKGYNQNNPYEFNKATFSSETGYQYNPPDYNGNDDFHSRYFNTYNVQNKILNQDESNNGTPKPFQTPYVSRIDEDSQEYDNYEKAYEDSGEHHDKEPDNKHNYPLHSGAQFNDNVGHNITDIFGIQHDNNPIHKTFGSHLQKANERYPYQQITFGKHPYNQFNIDPNLYSSSTAVPTEFTTRITMLQTQEPEFNIQNTIVDRKPTKYTPNVYQINSQFDKTNKLPSYSTIRPGSTNLPTAISSVYPKTGLKETNLNIDLATIPTLINSYSPGVEINHAEEHSAHPTTEKIIGEDFSGPKQQQRFDPLTGYHY